MDRQMRWFAVSVIAIFMAVTGAVLVVRQVYLFTRLHGERLRSIVATAAPAMDGDAHAELNTCLDRQCPNYQSLARYLREVQEANGLGAEVYTLARRGDHTIFVVRSEAEADIGRTYLLRDDMRPVFDEGRTVVTGIYRDRYGIWLSAYAPIRASTGRVVGLLEADYDAGALFGLIERDLLILFGIGVFGLLLCLYPAARLSERIAGPMEQLAKAADALGRGDATYPVPGEGPPEVVLLSRRFVAMRTSLAKARLEDRLALVGQMAGSIVHDLKNPLTTISGFAELIQQEGVDPEERRAWGDHLQFSVDRISRMCQEVLDFSKGVTSLSRALFSPAEVAAFACDELAPLAKRQGAVLRKDLAWAGEAWGDRAKLLRAVENVLRNALEASPEGAVVEARLTSRGGCWRLCIEDEAGGIPKEISSTLFEPFATSGKSSGTGLGLFVARSLVEAHEGTLTFRSREGVGTTFDFVLPIDCRRGVTCATEEEEAAVAEGREHPGQASRGVLPEDPPARTSPERPVNV